MSDREVEIGRFERLERWICWIAIAIGLLWRVQLSTETFDREFDGFQGAFFAVCSVNYERLGFDALGGYPVANTTAVADAPETWYPYPNHSPLVPWMAYGSARLLGPEGWSDAWRSGLAPEGLEFAIRLPFLVSYALALAALVILLRACGAPRAAWLAGALYALAPAGVLYGGLANYENPSVAALLFGFAAFATYLRSGRSLSLKLAALAFAGATAVTFAPAFFLPALALFALVERGWKGLLATIPIGVAAGVPVLAHGFASARVLDDLGLPKAGLVQRAQILVGPLFDVTFPFWTWLEVQGTALGSHFGLGLSLLGALGAGFCLVLALARGDRWRSTRVTLALLLGGALVQFGFYKHTADPQENFLLNLLPGFCAAGGVLLAGVGRSFERKLSAPAFTLALQVPVFLVVAIQANGLVEDFRGEGAPLPSETGEELARLLPADTIGWYPTELGFNIAVFYYAWRTMIPVGPGLYEAAAAQRIQFGLGEAPVSLVVPREPPPNVRAGVDRIGADLAPVRPGLLDGPPERETEHYRSYPLIER